MPLVFTMTSRMAGIAGACALLFSIVVFLLGMQIGTQFGLPGKGVIGAATAATADTVPTPPAATLSPDGCNDAAGVVTQDDAATPTAGSDSVATDTERP